MSEVLKFEPKIGKRYLFAHKVNKGLSEIKVLDISPSKLYFKTTYEVWHNIEKFNNEYELVEMLKGK